MTNCRYCDAVTSNFVYDVCDNCSGYANFAKQRRRAHAQEVSDSVKIECDILYSATVPNFVLMGTPSSGAATAMEAEVPRYKMQWNVSGAALEAEERRQRRDDHVDSLRYAMSGRRRSGYTPVGWQRMPAPEWMRCQKYPEAMEGGCDKPAGHDGFCSGPTKGFHGHDRGMPIYDFPCSCGRPIRGTDRDRGKRCEHETTCPGCGSVVKFTANDCLVHHYIGKAPCAWNGRRRAAVEQEWERIRSTPKPPTLREWLGPRVSELGPWAEVLREQPVPAGMIHRFEWERQADGSWWLYAHDTAGLEHVTPLLVARYLTEQGALHARAHDLAAWNDSLQMALFTRHPAVKPEPRPRVIGCEDQYEVMP